MLILGFGHPNVYFIIFVILCFSYYRRIISSTEDIILLMPDTGTGAVEAMSPHRVYILGKEADSDETYII